MAIDCYLSMLVSFLSAEREMEVVALPLVLLLKDLNLLFSFFNLSRYPLSLGHMLCFRRSIHEIFFLFFFVDEFTEVYNEFTEVYDTLSKNQLTN